MNYDEMLKQMEKEHNQRLSSIMAAREERERQMAELRRQEESRT